MTFRDAQSAFFFELVNVTDQVNDHGLTLRTFPSIIIMLFLTMIVKQFADKCSMGHLLLPFILC
jgi:hypothetical protein